MTDIIDQLAGLNPATSERLRGHRLSVVEASQAAAESLLPATLENDPVQGIDLQTRLLVAARAAIVDGHAASSQYYLSRLTDLGAATDAATDGADRGAGLAAAPKLRALLRHVDRLVLRPASTTETDLTALRSAGWSTAEIVVASQIVGFVTFQTRIATGLSVLARRPA